ncbi:unnamed protein product [Brachionus calyciflorus]|uniref:Uncharacterized protein n=1 Tax=Brachionus calyciflorus TaxID=104777 RepID=A0A813M8P4_9BILA|nr:unnamed protein product [Brachionus calyciflorus]
MIIGYPLNDENSYKLDSYSNIENMESSDENLTTQEFLKLILLLKKEYAEFLKKEEKFKANEKEKIGQDLDKQTKSSDSKEEFLMPNIKRAACGNMNGSPMHKWMCW